MTYRGVDKSHQGMAGKISEVIIRTIKVKPGLRMETEQKRSKK